MGGPERPDFAENEIPPRMDLNPFRDYPATGSHTETAHTETEAEAERDSRFALYGTLWVILCVIFIAGLANLDSSGEGVGGLLVLGIAITGAFWLAVASLFSSVEAPKAAPKTPHSLTSPQHQHTQPLLPGHGFVYLVRAGDRYKIGVTGDFEQRLKQLNRGQSPYPVERVHVARGRDAAAMEHRLHREFAGYRQHGEWFELGPDQVSAVIARLDAWRDSISAPIIDGEQVNSQLADQRRRRGRGEQLVGYLEHLLADAGVEDDEQLAAIEAELVELADEEHSSSADYWDSQAQKKGQEFEVWLRLQAQAVAELRGEYNEYLQ